MNLCMSVCVVVLDELLLSQQSLSSDLHQRDVTGHQSTNRLGCSVVGDDGVQVMCEDVDFMNTAGHVVDSTDVFYDTNLFSSSDLDDTDILCGLGLPNSLNLLSDSDLVTTRANVDVLADCESLMDAGKVELLQQQSGETLETQTLQLLSQAGIQQPAQRQIRLHSELVHHLHTPPDHSVLTRPDSMIVKPQTSISSESELVRMLTSSVEDESLVMQHLPQHEIIDADSTQYVQVMSVQSAATNSNSTVPTDSELVRQLSLATGDLQDASSALTGSTLHHHHHQQQRQQHQRVALVQPTIAHQTQDTANVDSSQRLMIDQPHAAMLTQQLAATASLQQPQPASVIQHVIQQPQSTVPAVSIMQPPTRQIVITTQAPVHTQHVPQISLQQLQLVGLHGRLSLLFMNH